MNKIQRTIEALKTATQELNDTMHVLSINMRGQSIRVHVNTMRDLEQIPGQAKIADLGDKYMNPIQYTKHYYGVEFFCLLSRDEYKEAV